MVSNSVRTILYEKFTSILVQHSPCVPHPFSGHEASAKHNSVQYKKKADTLEIEDWRVAIIKTASKSQNAEKEILKTLLSCTHRWKF